jgi:Uma2 family endonuclease
MSTVTQAPATLDDLYKVDGQSELIAGRIIKSMPAGMLHNRVSKAIFLSLHEYATRTGVGEAFTDSLGYAIRPPMPNGRESFSPDASYHAGPLPADEWLFIDGPPTFAAEDRSPDDYGPVAERQMAEKRADYFAAGSLVVWDVDPDGETVAKYQAADPTRSTVFRRGQIADAEPAVPNWQMPVDAIFG